MIEDDTERSVTAYVLFTFAGLGMLLGMAGVVVASVWAALTGGIIMLLALIVYQARVTSE